ncbi:histidine kinase [Streptomyces sp. NPDC047525]|uniref:sensor histidine kinase n=1 Tax=Streptomyces sp. NPDC047525 TaxID=3155264 RepID=UPI0033EBC431
MHSLHRVIQRLRPPLLKVWKTLTFLAAGIPLQLVSLLCALLPKMIPVLTLIQRYRFQTVLGVEIARTPENDRRTRWRQAKYHLLSGPAVALAAAVGLALWLVGFAAGTVYIWVWELPLEWRLAHHGYSVTAGYVMAAGLAVLAFATWACSGLTRLDALAARKLLGPTRAEILEQRVENLTESRAGVVEAADAERRRIERDLHDGAQQRLVAMAVNLGLARATLGDQLPDDAREVIDEAHREAKEAISELGNLVRGLHPAVLEDRGLDAALSGIAERVPLPVRLNVELAERPLPTVEAVAYFVVSEALTNVIKHAEASRIDVTVGRIGDSLLVIVSDDGVGGADAAAGTGLDGLAKRVASVDGSLAISSPAGGPTVLTVTLPCEP